MAKMPFIVHGRREDVTLQEIMQEFGLDDRDVDVEYGVQLIDPTVGDYAILVEESAIARIDPEQAGLTGPYSDVEIETFGPPES